MVKIQQSNIQLTRGDSLPLSVQLKDTSGTQVDLAIGDKIYFTVKKNPFVEEKIFQKEITTFVGGIASIDILPADTANLVCGVYTYDIQYTRVDGYKQTLLGPAKFEVLPEVTYE